MRNLPKVLLAVLVCLLSAGFVFAQGDLGALTGTVLDPTGAVIPDAGVTITNIATGVNYSVKSSSAGYYRSPVPPGTYRLEADKQGFKKGVADNIAVPVAQVVTVDLTLQVGSETETVTVTTEAPLLSPSTAEVSAAVTPEEFQTLPIQVGDGGRQLQTFIFTSLPGTVGDTFAGSINGGQLFSHEILIDGVTIGRYDLSGGSLDEFSPGTDAIGEFKLQMTNYSAEYGETGGGIANFVYKSGTNHLHGTLFEYNKNPIFNAAGLLANAFGTAKRNEKENNFGGTIGGPITIPKVYNGKDRSFFFFSYEGDRFRSFAFSGLTTLPTTAMRQGDFSGFLLFDPKHPGTPLSAPKLQGTDALGRPVYRYEIYDPTTTRNVTAGLVDPVSRLVAASSATIRDPFMAGGQLNMIPAGEFSKASSVLLPLFPNPLFGGLANNTPRFSGCCPVLKRDAWTIKIDHVINSKQRLTASFTDTRRDRFNRNGTTFPPFPGQPISPYKEQIVGGPQVRFAHSWTINDHTVNELSLGYNRFNNVNNSTTNAKYTSQLGIPGIPNLCFPTMRFSDNNKAPLIGLIGVGCENIDPSESYVYQDTYSSVHGKHSLKFGGEFRRYRYNTFEPGPQSGNFGFANKETSLPGFANLTGHAFASFILGAADSGGRSVYTTEPGYRAGVFTLFVQDDYKASAKLTLNIGLRWELPLPKTEAFNRQSGFDPTLPNPGADNMPGALAFLGSCSTCIHRNSFQDWYYKEFGPRLGVAYEVNKNLVLRGGYGISYGPPILNNFGSQNLFGFNSGVPIFHAPGTLGQFNPATYLSPLTGAPLPAGAQIGVPLFTGTLPNRDPASANGQALDFLPKKSLAQPYVQNWSLGFQYQLPRRTVLEANYIGSKGTRLLNSNWANWYNQAPGKYMGLGDLLIDDLATDLADPVNGPILASYGITKVPSPSFEANNPNPTVGIALQAYPQYSGLTNNYPTIGNSTYHSLQVMARKNTAHGLTFIAAYTLSKTLTDTDSALYYPSYVQDFYNRRLEKSIASFDYPQVLKLTSIYELPFGRGRKWLNSAGSLDRLFSGWQITAIQNYRSGNPLQIGSADGTAITPSVRADIIPGVKQTVPLVGLDVSAGGGTPYLNPAAFADPPASPLNTFALRVGTAPRFLTHVRGPGFESEDFGVIKNTRLSESVGFQVRADAFNVLNRTGRGDPDTSLGSGTFGQIHGPAHGPRVIQLALRINF